MAEDGLQHDQQPHRHLSLLDLLLIGVGGTVGSGMFVLTGRIARLEAGPLAFVSMAIAGAAAAMSGVCYAELSSKIPGSTYAYVKACGMGRAAAAVGAACLTLEYAVAGAAVARSWGDKIILISEDHGWTSAGEALHPWNLLHLPACGVSFLSMLLLLNGIEESKNVSNIITTIKMVLVFFMVIGGFCLFRPENAWQKPLAPFGVGGVLKGATSSFFGYLGYDEVCIVAGEAINPTRDMPRAVLGTIAIVTVLYVLAALALTGMLPWEEIDATSGFPQAFAERQWPWAASITAWGEVLTLPVVVLISLMAQPRLTLEMARDGLLPNSLFGNLWAGTLVSGITMTVIATFVPFTFLDDVIGAGILLAFSLTNSSLVLLRTETRPLGLMVIYNFVCFLSAFSWRGFPGWLVPVFTLPILGGLVRYMQYHHPCQSILVGLDRESNAGHFSAPAVPWLPCGGILVNWYLVAQLEGYAMFGLLLYVGLVLLLYFVCGTNNRPTEHYESVDEEEEQNGIQA